MSSAAAAAAASDSSAEAPAASSSRLRRVASTVSETWRRWAVALPTAMPAST